MGFFDKRATRSCVALQALVFVTISLLLASTEATASASAAGRAAAPAFFAEPSAVRDTRDRPGHHVPLHAPRYLAHNAATDEADAAAGLISRQQAQAISRRTLHQRASAPQSNSSRSSASNENDKSQSLGLLGDSYYAPLNVSSDDPQMVFVSLDTGSSDLWIVSSSCQSQQCNDDRILKFDETKSSSYSTLQISGNANVSVSSSSNVTQANNSSATTNLRLSVAEGSDTLARRKLGVTSMRTMSLAAAQDGSTVPFQVQYDDQSIASGVLGVDSVALADVARAKQIFGLVSDTNVSLAPQGISGVLGMGFARGSAIARSLIGETTGGAFSSPLLASILSTSNESYPIFTLSLDRTAGTLTLGAADAAILPDEQSRGNVEWHDVVPFPSGNSAEARNATANTAGEALGQYVYWALELSAAGFNGSSVDLTPTYDEAGPRPLVLIDSGTAGLLGPTSAVEAMFAQVNGARHVGNGRYVVPCTAQERMYFSFGGRDFTLLPSDYIIGPASGNPYLCLSWPAAVPSSADGVDWILGQTFLRAQYSLFSLGIARREAPKIGFYPLRAPADPNAPSSAVLAPQPSADVASFVSKATPVLTTLPNSLVPVSSARSTPSYIFANATTTGPLGLPPTIALNMATGAAGTSTAAIANDVPPSTYRPLLTASTGDEQLPVLASNSPALPLPSNPAVDPSNAAMRLVPAHGDHTLLVLTLLLAALVSAATSFASR